MPPEILSGILKEIDREFDGHSVEGYVDGTYRMADGSMAQDKSLKVWVAVTPDQVENLRLLARRFAARLKQESLWFETTDAEVEFSGIVLPGMRVITTGRVVFFRRRKLRCAVEMKREDGTLVCSGTLSGMGVPK